MPTRTTDEIRRSIETNRAELAHSLEHGAYPDPDQVGDQLTLFSDTTGAVSKSKSPPYLFGPYVRNLPPQTTGPRKGSAGIASKDAPGVGWLYDHVNGIVTPNIGAPSKGVATTAPSDTVVESGSSSPD